MATVRGAPKPHKPRVGELCSEKAASAQAAHVDSTRSKWAMIMATSSEARILVYSDKKKATDDLLEVEVVIPQGWWFMFPGDLIHAGAANESETEQRRHFVYLQEPVDRTYPIYTDKSDCNWVKEDVNWQQRLPATSDVEGKYMTEQFALVSKQTPDCNASVPTVNEQQPQCEVAPPTISKQQSQCNDSVPPSNTEVVMANIQASYVEPQCDASVTTVKEEPQGAVQEPPCDDSVPAKYKDWLLLNVKIKEEPVSP